MKIALAQIDMGYENIPYAKQKVEQMVKDASIHHGDLIIFPEMTLTGFTMNQIVDDTIIPYFDHLANLYHISIAYGYIEEGYYNACNITNGKTLCHYQKIHPFLKESNYYQKGNTIGRTKIKDFTLSPTICYDLRFPILYYKAAKKADIIIVIASWPDLRDEHWLALLKARAIENQCYIIGVNRIGHDPNNHYIGHSIAYDGWGNALNELVEDERNIYIEIDHQDYPSRFIDDQRNDLYIQLLKE